jgi:hypothetical protein
MERVTLEKLGEWLKPAAAMAGRDVFGFVKIA